MKYFLGLFFMILVVIKQSDAQFVVNKVIPPSIELKTNVEVVNLNITTNSNNNEQNTDVLNQRKWLSSAILHRELNNYYHTVTLPAYVQGKFCDFEDAINKGNPFRIDFSVK